jgi:hypothetical protein
MAAQPTAQPRMAPIRRVISAKSCFWAEASNGRACLSGAARLDGKHGRQHDEDKPGEECCIAEHVCDCISPRIHGERNFYEGRV